MSTYEDDEKIWTRDEVKKTILKVTQDMDPSEPIYACDLAMDYDIDYDLVVEVMEDMRKAGLFEFR